MSSLCLVLIFKNFETMTYITKLGEKNPLLGCLQDNHIDLMINFCVIFLGLVPPPPKK